MGRYELLDRIDRVGRSGALHLDGAHLDGFETGERDPRQRQAICSGGDDHSCLLPRVPGDDDEEPMQREHVPHLRRGHHVTDVGWVERAAEDPDAFPHSRTVHHMEPLDDAVRLRIRVWLPDRPGALGLVASRIGSLGADIVGIEVLERGDRVAVDEFSVVLSQASLVDLLVREIGEVDGASVEQCVTVAQFGDPRLDALDTVEALAGAGDLDAMLVAKTCGEFGADWAAILVGGEMVAVSGAAPSADVLAALDAGTSASPLVASGQTGPDDLLVAPIGERGALLVGRATPPFRFRERQQLLALGRIADALHAR